MFNKTKKLFKEFSTQDGSYSIAVFLVYFLVFNGLLMAWLDCFGLIKGNSTIIIVLITGGVTSGGFGFFKEIKAMVTK